MSVALYIDENVHRGITNGLRLRGVDVLTVPGLTQKLPKSLIYRTAKTPRTPRIRRVCVSPKYKKMGALAFLIQLYLTVQQNLSVFYFPKMKIF
ncbi:hypothetical protein LC613_03750 [Nostoc sphaeroides CHAB 2801]|uniref:hypothetical protein n=1 Tax=Nostoc sphaeroides TaxID=446679 RepID=UPI001C706307|nr:hypothetical protein [Nostoc sphaeroides]MCC5627323.1 hypothetical protein [Nostoc sphaeroides CHAB 2801]